MFTPPVGAAEPIIVVDPFAALVVITAVSASLLLAGLRRVTITDIRQETP